MDRQARERELRRGLHPVTCEAGGLKVTGERGAWHEGPLLDARRVFREPWREWYALTWFHTTYARYPSTSFFLSLRPSKFTVCPIWCTWFGNFLSLILDGELQADGSLLQAGRNKKKYSTNNTRLRILSILLFETYKHQLRNAYIAPPKYFRPRRLLCSSQVNKTACAQRLILCNTWWNYEELIENLISLYSTSFTNQINNEVSESFLFCFHSLRFTQRCRLSWLSREKRSRSLLCSRFTRPISFHCQSHRVSHRIRATHQHTHCDT